MQVISINNVYSSALRRLAAFLVDQIAISVILNLFLVFRWGAFPGVHLHDWDYHARWFDLNWAFGLWWVHVARTTIWVIYFALMESSKYQATLGKIALGIKVVDQNNQRLQFNKALLRNLSKLLSSFLLGIGYIMIIFDERKQGLHDKIADTFVVKQ
jgi:uncharacterized RDD family membrane protein YckC